MFLREKSKVFSEGTNIKIENIGRNVELTYESCHYCKPNPEYYVELLERHDLKPEECIMVGNDVEEDIIPTQNLGMQGFLLLHCLINKKEVDISGFSRGDYEALKLYLADKL